MSAVAGPPRRAARRGLLSYRDQVRLAKAIEAGREAEDRLDDRRLPGAERRRLEETAALGAAARRELIEAHAPLVLTEAQRYAGPERRTMVELVQQGNSGLVRAVDSFDWHAGARFSAHAARWIRLAIAAERPELPDPRAALPDPRAVTRYRDRVVSLDAGHSPAGPGSVADRGAAEVGNGDRGPAGSVTERPPLSPPG